MLEFDAGYHIKKKSWHFLIYKMSHNLMFTFASVFIRLCINSLIYLLSHLIYLF